VLPGVAASTVVAHGWAMRVAAPMAARGLVLHVAVPETQQDVDGQATPHVLVSLADALV